MAILEDIGGFAGGLAEGGAQGTQLALQQERIDALGRAENIREERFELERPLIEEDIAGIEDRKKLRIAALDEQQSKAEIASAEAAKVEDFRSIGDFFVETLGEVATPSMVQKFEERFRLTHGSSINKPGMINRKQFEEFFEDFREAPDFKETYTDIFTSGIAESEERKGVLNTELSKLSEKGPPDQKAFEKGKQLQAEIAEHEEAKNIFNRMIGRVNDISEQPEEPLTVSDPQFQSDFDFIKDKMETAENPETRMEFMISLIEAHPTLRNEIVQRMKLEFPDLFSGGRIP
ncbi:hypothetical protein LCGC14_1348410 [marine sediment metagenome]|uniref:Uncharacterized protein n=1 Tax=marine sediment metagenome TaxID=412755 RepID=A0A0F9KC86_9ZZZZ